MTAGQAMRTIFWISRFVTIVGFIYLISIEPVRLTVSLADKSTLTAIAHPFVADTLTTQSLTESVENAPIGIDGETWQRIIRQIRKDTLTDPIATSQIAQVTASDGAESAGFGNAVAVNGDTLVVGAYHADIGGNQNQGAVYLFLRNEGGTGNWGEFKKLTASDGASGDEFGKAVAINGDTIVIGAPGAEIGSNSNQGAVYLFLRDQGGIGNWGEFKKLAANDGSLEGKFGNAVALSGDTVIIGAPDTEVASKPGQGAAYLFARHQGGTEAWGQVKKLIANDGSAYNSFGGDVAVDDETVVISAPTQGDSHAGAAYIFIRNVGGADNWGQIKKLNPTSMVGGFGRSIAISNDIIVVGAPWLNTFTGSAYLFARNQGGANNWGAIKALTTDDSTVGAIFGGSVAVRGDTVIIGAAGTLGSSENQGSVYLFERNQGGTDNWGQVKKFTDGDGVGDDGFGSSVAINGNTIIAGISSSNSFLGGVYLFDRDQGGTSNWGQTKKLTHRESGEGDQFSFALAFSNDLLVVGSPKADVGGNKNQGAAYLFARNQGGENQWGEIKKFVGSDGAAGDQFGNAVAIAGDTVIVGASYADIEARENQGAVYLFARNEGGPERWGEVKKLTASDGAAGHYFGHAVAISGDIAVIGTYRFFPDQGTAYLFARNQGGANNWGEVKMLTVNTAYDYFGSAVAISGDTVVIGASWAEMYRGAAYIFEREQNVTGDWKEVKKLTAGDGQSADIFGNAVAVSGDTVIVGAPRDNNSQGSAYLFVRNAGGTDNWGEIKKLTASDGAADHYFGAVVASNGNAVVVGASSASVGSNRKQGGVYLFARDAGGQNQWREVQKLTANNGSSNDLFGSAVGISENKIVVGAMGDKDGQGAAYIFALNHTPTITAQRFNVDETAPVGTIVGTITASDMDDGQTINYTITDGNRGNAFAVNSSNGQITVNRNTPLDFESSPYITLTITAIDNGAPALSASATMTVTINDINDTLSVSSAIVNEGSGSAIFMVTLAAISGVNVRVNYVTSNGSALAGSDYRASSGTVILIAGQNIATISVPILEDNLEESDETFIIMLSEPVNATLAGSQGVGTIVDNDATSTPTYTPTPTPTYTPTPTPTPTQTSPSGPSVEGDAYETDDTCAQARVLVPDGSLQAHTFHIEADTDWVQFPVVAGGEYLIEVTIPPASPADVVLELYNDCRQLPLTGQDYTFSPGVRLRQRADATGTFWLQLVNHERTVAGAQVHYNLTVRNLQEMGQPGAAIIVAGKFGNNDPVEPNIYHVTKAARQLFIDHAYTDERIYYLAPDRQQANVDALSTAANLEAAITTWAAGKVGPTQALTLYLMDHGDQGYFYLDQPRGEWITPEQLNRWLTVLEAKQPGVKINVIIEACYAGSFIRAAQSLSKPGRVIITSTDNENLAWASRDGALFSDHLLGALQRGESLYNSFREAQIAARIANRAQHAWLDGDGNGQPEESSDQVVAAQRGFAFVGTFPADQWPPYIAQVQPPTTMENGRGQIRADVRDDLKVTDVWAVIYPPSYVAPTTGEALVQEALDTIKLLDQGNGWYGATYAGFHEKGNYRIVIFAEDGQGMPARPVAINVETGRQLFLPLVLR